MVNKKVFSFIIIMSMIFIGEGIDYVSGPYSVTIPAGMIRASFNVSVVYDIILETDENFILTIISSSQPSHVIIKDPTQATVIIMDDDGKQTSHHLDNNKNNNMLRMCEMQSLSVYTVKA